MDSVALIGIGLSYVHKLIKDDKYKSDFKIQQYINRSDYKSYLNAMSSVRRRNDRSPTSPNV